MCHNQAVHCGSVGELALSFPVQEKKGLQRGPIRRSGCDDIRDDLKLNPYGEARS